MEILGAVAVAKYQTFGKRPKVWDSRKSGCRPKVDQGQVADIEKRKLAPMSTLPENRIC